MWKLIHTSTLEGAGSSRTVSLGYFGCRVMVEAGETQAFYVSAKSSIFMNYTRERSSAYEQGLAAKHTIFEGGPRGKGA